MDGPDSVRPIDLSSAVTTFRGSVYCHVPGTAPFRASALASVDDENDRWGCPGRRTVYLASDPGVALAELGRHLEADGSQPEERRLLRLQLRPVSLVDLRDGRAAEALGVGPWPQAAISRSVARDVALRIREMGLGHGLLVPSVAFLDTSHRFNVVLFAESLGEDLDALLLEPEEVGGLRLKTAWALRS
jgi:hypothetical protein